MKVKETKKGTFIVHTKNEVVSYKSVYDFCKAKVKALKADEGIKHVRYVYEKLKRQVERYDKEVKLYESIMRRFEIDGKTEDETSIFDSNE